MHLLVSIGIIVSVALFVLVIGILGRTLFRAFGVDVGLDVKSPGPGDDPENPEAEFYSAGYWFAVETWPALVPGWLFRPMTYPLGFVFYLVLGIPLTMALSLVDSRVKVAVYRRSRNSPFLRLVHVEYFPDEVAAEAKQSELLSRWDPSEFIGRRPLGVAGAWRAWMADRS